MVVFMFCNYSSAEMRVWQDKNGNRFKAKFIRELFGDLLLEKPDGKSRFVKPEDLSAADRAYVFENIPPEMEISFSKSKHLRPLMDWTIPQDVTTLYTCTVRVDKKSDLPYTGKLTAELFLIGDEVDGDNFVLEHREEARFVFPEGRHSSFTFKAVDVPFRKYYSAWMEVGARYRGVEYKGYVIGISDADGKLVASKTDISDAKWLTDDMSATVQGLRKIARVGRGSAYSRHFDTGFNKVDIESLPWFKRTNVF